MRRRTDIWAGWILAAASLLTLLWLIPSQTSPAQSVHNMSPAMMPSVAVALLLLLAVVLVLTRLVSAAPVRVELDEEFGTEATGLGRRDLIDVALWAATSVAAMALLRYAGFIVAGVVLLAGTMLFMGQRNPWAIGATALVTPLSIWLIASYAFNVQLP